MRRLKVIVIVDPILVELSPIFVGMTNLNVECRAVAGVYKVDVSISWLNRLAGARRFAFFDPNPRTPRLQHNLRVCGAASGCGCAFLRGGSCVCSLSGQFSNRMVTSEAHPARFQNQQKSYDRERKRRINDKRVRLHPVVWFRKRGKHRPKDDWRHLDLHRPIISVGNSVDALCISPLPTDSIHIRSGDRAEETACGNDGLLFFELHQCAVGERAEVVRRAVCVRCDIVCGIRPPQRLNVLHSPCSSSAAPDRRSQI